VSPLQIMLNLRRNTLEFRLRGELGEPAVWETRLATIDIGEAGRLLGVEIDLSTSPQCAEPWTRAAPPPGDFDPATGSLYIALDSRVDDLARTATGTALTGIDRNGRLMTVEIPRRGEGYEISYPSGNQ
jgi:uncharacterized protein YuzE